MVNKPLISLTKSQLRVPVMVFFIRVDEPLTPPASFAWLAFFTITSGMGEEIEPAAFP